MKRLLLLLALACGSDNSLTEIVTKYDRQYVLTSLVYEDVIPGAYAAKLEGFNGGPARMEFGDSLGQLAVDAVVGGTLNAVFPDSTTASQAVTVLPQGKFEFSFTVDSTNLVIFSSGPPLWPIVSGVLTDSAFTFDGTDCFNPDCTDYIRLMFTWTRQF